MNKTNKIMLLACLLSPFYTHAQTEGDAIRYSGSTFGTTARSLAMGGAFGALGADFSTLSTNPAGIANYKKSEFSFSPTFNYRNVSSQYCDRTADDSRFYFNLGSIGFVYAPEPNAKRQWQGMSFGFGYNRDDCYKRNEYYEGFNTKNSMMDAFAEKAHGVPYSSFDQINYAFDVGLAWNAYLINNAQSGPTDYESAIPNGGVLQRKTSDIIGNKGSFLLSLGNNYKDLILIGGTVEFSTFRYEDKSVYDEIDTEDSIISPFNHMDFKSLSYFQNKRTTGRGVTGKFGVIVKPTKFLRLGASIHTPTYYNVYYDDYYNMIGYFGHDSILPKEDQSLVSNFHYHVTTPFKVVGSIAFIINKTAIISAEYEMVDYPMTTMRSDDYNFSSENANIKTITKVGSNFKFGAEYKWDVFFVRGGAAFYGSPFEDKFVNSDYSFASTSYTCGVGLREKNFFVDFGYAFTQSKQSYQPYYLNSEDVPSVFVTTNTNRMMFTMGVKF